MSNGGGWNWGDIAAGVIGAGAQYYNNKQLADQRADELRRQEQLTRDTQGRQGWEAISPILGGLAGQIIPTYQNSMNRLGSMPTWGQFGGGGGGVSGASGNMQDILGAAQDYALGFTQGPLWQSGVGAITGRLGGQTGNPMMDAAFAQAQQFANSGDRTGAGLASANPYIDPTFQFYQQFAQSRDNPGGLQDYINRQRDQTENGLGFELLEGDDRKPRRRSERAFDYSRMGSGGGGGSSARSSLGSAPGGGMWMPGGDHGGAQSQVGPGGPVGPMPPSPDGYAQTGPTGAAGMIREQYNKELSDFMNESNPYLSSVIGDVADDLQSQHARNLALTDASAEGAGRYGSSAFNLERAAQAADLMRQQSRASNQLRFQDYNTQLGRFDTNRQNAMGLGTQMDMNQLDNDTRRAIAQQQAAAQRASAAAAANAARYGQDLQHDLGLRGLELEALLGQQSGSLAGAQGMSGLAGLFGDLQGTGAGLNAQYGLGGLNAMQGLAGLFQGSQDAALGMIPQMGALPMGIFGGAFDMAQGVNSANQAAQQANQAARGQAYRHALQNWQAQTQLPWDFLGNAVNLGMTLEGHRVTPVGI